MKIIIGLVLLPLLAYGALGNSIDDPVNSKLLEALVAQQSPVESTATIAHTSPLGSVASMAPMMDFGMPYMSPFGNDFLMPYASSVMPYMGAGASFSPFTPYMNPYTYSGMGMPAISPPLMGYPAYTSVDPLMSSLVVNQQAVPFAAASTYHF